MKDVVRSTCPTCSRPLVIPAQWTGKSVRCKHCGQAMEVRRKAAVANGASAVPRALPVESDPPPTWEPLPASDELSEFTPPASPAGNGPLVTALPAEERYTGRGRYKGPKNRGWLKYAVLGLFFAGLAGG